MGFLHARPSPWRAPEWQRGSGGGKGVGWGGERRGRRPQVGRAPPSPAGGRGKPRPPGRNFPRPAPARSPQGGLRTRDAAQVDLKGAGESSARPPRLSRRYSRLSQGHPLIQPGPSERAEGAHLRAAAGPRRGGSRGRRAGGDSWWARRGASASRRRRDGGLRPSDRRRGARPGLGDDRCLIHSRSAFGPPRRG